MLNTKTIVNNSKELTNTLKNASAGQTIYLDGGGENYTLSLKNVTFTGGVTLASLDPADKATFNSIKLDNVSNLKVDGVEFNSVGVERAAWMTDVFVEDSHNISVLNSTMTSNASAFNNGTVTVGANAVRVKNTDGFTFENNEVSKYNFGVQVVNSDHVQIANNNIHHLQADGLQFSDVDDIVIKGNYIHDFYASLFTINHNDMIQFYTSGTQTASENIVIRDNVLDSGNGNFTQSIFFGNEAVTAGAGQEMFYKNVLVEDNTIYNNNYHGITFYQTDGLTIRNNTVLLNQETPQREFKNDSIYIIVKPGSLDVTVADNVAGKLQIDSPATLSNNITLDYKNAAAANYYLKVLDLSHQTDTAHIDGIRLLGTNTDVQNLLKAGVALGSDLFQPLAPIAAQPTTVERAPEPSVIQGGAGHDALHGGTLAETILGGEGNDTIHGGGGGDTIDGGDGNDQIWGEAGNDILHGGLGADKLYGGDGNDTLHGGASNDQMYGDAGDDPLFGDEGDDHMDGGAGNDTLEGGAGNDHLYGGEGVDILRGGTGNDHMEGGAGNDVLHASAGDDTMRGDDGDDTLFGEDGNDGLRGGAGHDHLYAGVGNDMLWGEDGNDTLDGGAGRDNYYGGGGRDTFVLNKGEIEDDRINDYASKDDTIVFHGFSADASLQKLSGNIFAIHDTDGSTAQFRVTVTDGGPINWVFA